MTKSETFKNIEVYNLIFMDAMVVVFSRRSRLVFAFLFGHKIRFGMHLMDL